MINFLFKNKTPLEVIDSEFLKLESVKENLLNQFEKAKTGLQNINEQLELKQRELTDMRIEITFQSEEIKKSEERNKKIIEKLQDVFGV